MATLIALIVIFWGLPIFYGQHLGLRRNRSGWAYGFLGGWVGVIILSLTSYLPSDAERQVRELEAQQRLAKLTGEEPPEAKTGVLGSFGLLGLGDGKS